MSAKKPWQAKGGWDGKAFLIGRYQLGYRMVRVWAEPGASGAWFNLCKNEEEAQIHVSMEYKDQGYAFQAYCHEIWEMACDDERCVLEPKNAFVGAASDCCMFVYNHNQHTEITARASFLILSSIDDFRKAFSFVKAGPKKRPLARKRSGK